MWHSHEKGEMACDTAIQSVQYQVSHLSRVYLGKSDSGLKLCFDSGLVPSSVQLKDLALVDCLPESNEPVEQVQYELTTQVGCDLAFVCTFKSGKELRFESLERFKGFIGHESVVDVCAHNEPGGKFATSFSYPERPCFITTKGVIWHSDCGPGGRTP
eukprot:37768-Rhodomonas_salina.1